MGLLLYLPIEELPGYIFDRFAIAMAMAVPRASLCIRVLAMRAHGTLALLVLAFNGICRVNAGRKA
jgi:hypothetical protein